MGNSSIGEIDMICQLETLLKQKVDLVEDGTLAQHP